MAPPNAERAAPALADGDPLKSDSSGGLLEKESKRFSASWQASRPLVIPAGATPDEIAKVLLRELGPTRFGHVKAAVIRLSNARAKSEALLHAKAEWDSIWRVQL